MAQKIQRERYRLLLFLERMLEGPMVFLGFIWLLLLIVDIIWGLSQPMQNVSLAIWVIFLIDFFIKFIVTPSKTKFFKKNWLTAISLLIPAIRIFRVFRILRMLRSVRLVRVIASLNRSMRGLSATVRRRGFGYVMLLSVCIIFGGAAGMYGLERPNAGFETYGMALWWTAMRVITAGSDFWPVTPEGKVFAFILSLYGYAIFGYVTATLATFFIGRDKEENKNDVKNTDESRQIHDQLKAINERLNKITE